MSPTKPSWRRGGQAIALAISTLGLGLVGVVFAAAPPANAHNSTYCGHGKDGIRNVTEYRDNNGTREGAIDHQHKYHHDMFFARDHTVWKNC